jgi:hypothetical protein
VKIERSRQLRCSHCGFMVSTRSVQREIALLSVRQDWWFMYTHVFLFNCDTVPTKFFWYICPSQRVTITIKDWNKHASSSVINILGLSFASKIVANDLPETFSFCWSLHLTPRFMQFWRIHYEEWIYTIYLVLNLATQWFFV